MLKVDETPFVILAKLVPAGSKQGAGRQELNMNLTDIFRKIKTITPDKAKPLIEEKAPDELELLDVREPVEYELGHIPGAKLLPLSELVSRLGEIDPSKTAITYCARGRRSASAASLMKGQGFDDVYSL